MAVKPQAWHIWRHRLPCPQQHMGQQIVLSVYIPDQEMQVKNAYAVIGYNEQRDTYWTNILSPYENGKPGSSGQKVSWSGSQGHYDIGYPEALKDLGARIRREVGQ